MNLLPMKSLASLLNRFDFSDVESSAEVVKTLSALVQTKEGQEQLRQFLGGKYLEMADDAKPLIDFVVNMAGGAVKDNLLPIFSGLIEVQNSCREDKRFGAAIRKSQALNAKASMDLFKAYIRAGFKHDEAMSLLLTVTARDKQIFEQSLARAVSISKKSE